MYLDTVSEVAPEPAPVLPDKNTYSQSQAHAPMHQHEHSQLPCSQVFKTMCLWSVFPVLWTQPYKNRWPRTFLRNAAAQGTAQAGARLDKLEKPCDSWSSSTPPRTQVRNTDV